MLLRSSSTAAATMSEAKKQLAKQFGYYSNALALMLAVERVDAPERAANLLDD
jgi:hypothetical protein